LNITDFALYHEKESSLVCSKSCEGVFFFVSEESIIPFLSNYPRRSKPY